MKTHSEKRRSDMKTFTILHIAVAGIFAVLLLYSMLQWKKTSETLDRSRALTEQAIVQTTEAIAQTTEARATAKEFKALLEQLEAECILRVEPTL